MIGYYGENSLLKVKMRSTRGNPIVKPDQDDGKSGAVATSANASLLLGDKLWEEAGDEANKKSELVLEDDLNEKISTACRVHVRLDNPGGY